MATAGHTRDFRSQRSHRDPQGYYRLLGLPPTATSEEIKLAFRDMAKKLHPDHGGRGADAETFRRLLEAYEVLRDDGRRAAYDRLARSDNDGPRRRSTSSHRPRQRKWRLRWGALRSPYLWSTLVLLVGLGGMTLMWRQSERALYEHRIVASQLYQRLDRALAEQAEARRREALAATPGSVRALLGEGSPPANRAANTTEATARFRADIVFPLGSRTISNEVRVSADQAIGALRRAIDQLPGGRDWRVVVEARSTRATAENRVAIDEWEPGLLRMGAILSYLVAQGLPQDRLAARFEAGLDDAAQGDAIARTIRIELRCCDS